MPQRRERAGRTPAPDFRAEPERAARKRTAGSSPWHKKKKPGCQATGLSDGGPPRTRTLNLLIKSQLLYQLS